MDQKIIQQAIATHKELVAQFEANSIDIMSQAAEMITEALRQGGKLYLCGNGGSAADCQHIAGELIGRFHFDRNPIPAVALSTDTSVITCTANDYAFEEVFARQVKALVTARDILWAFSTSGESANVIAAAKAARDKGAKVLAFTGKAKSALNELADLCFGLEASHSSHAQEIHQLAYHIICALVEQEMASRAE